MKRRPDRLQLADYRRRVAAMYAEVRSGVGTAEARWRRFRRARDELFREHPQSALPPEDRAAFDGLDYFPYDPALRLEVGVHPVDVGQSLEVTLQAEGSTRLERVGRLEFQVGSEDVSLSLYWIHSYGGGLFLPFRDATNGAETYGGGRYLLDSIKGADLGSTGARLILDFNFAYNPSCAYDPRWHCPLAPVENWLEVPISAGEKAFAGEQMAEPDPSAIPQAAGG